MSIVIALGGNAIDSPIKEDKKNPKSLDNFCKAVSELIRKGEKIIITHGNGPQVGNLFLQQEVSKNYVNPLSLNVCVALSQAQIGALLEQKFLNVFLRLKINKSAIPVLTHVLVDSKDSAFKNPIKPIGPAYTEQEAKKIESAEMIIKQTPEGLYRRVVASPYPQKILELNVIKNLVQSGVLTIACGGGGIPIIEIKRQKSKVERLKSADAVIDKDLVSALLAKEMKAKKLIILTNVDYVSLNYRKPNEEKIKNLKVKEVKKYLNEKQFPEGSMGPKIKAAIDFLENGGKEVAIGHLKNIGKILKNQSGTIITR